MIINTDVSILIPFLNEEKNLPVLIQQLKDVFSKIKKTYEIILVDDGSTDKSLESIEINENIKLLTHKKRMGKGKALITAFQKSSGKIIIFMDADLQDDPYDIPSFLEKIDYGFDLVNGWRKKRNGGLIKTLPSFFGNTIILRTILQSNFHDINCGFKAMRRDVLENIPLYGDNFRFLPLFAEKGEYKTTEVVVHHHERKHGISKFGFFRRFSIFADILTTYVISRFVEKPLHFFGSIGFLVFSIGLAGTIYLGIERIFFGVLLHDRPILWLFILFTITGMQIILTGITAEIIVYLHNKKR